MADGYDGGRITLNCGRTSMSFYLGPSKYICIQYSCTGIQFDDCRAETLLYTFLLCFCSVSDRAETCN